MSTTGETGFLFSLDLLLAFLAMLLMLSLMLMHWEAAKERETSALERLALQRQAIFLIDSMVKNSNEERPLLGSALFDEEKRRVLSNELDLALLAKSGQLHESEFFASSVSVSSGGVEKRVELAQPGKNCIGLDRLVLIEGNLGKLGVVVCEG